MTLFEEALTLDLEALFLELEVLAQKVWVNQQLAEAFEARQSEEKKD